VAFLRRLFTRPPDNRGTLTLLPDGEFLLGLPHKSDERTAHEASQAIKRWLDGDPQVRSLVFPFPVDIVDRRGEKVESLMLWPRYGNFERPLERIAQVLERIDRKTVKRRPRIIMCQHPELHPDEQIG
jgi:hypothetical protein